MTKKNSEILSLNIISKKKILNKWFKDLFKWLFRCEKIFGFENLDGPMGNTSHHNCDVHMTKTLQ